jgi:hypothetical protein
MSEIVEQIQENVERGRESRLNGQIALFVAVIATFVALCNVKDGNVVQAMQQAQAKSIDQWAYYQSKSTKQNIAENTAEVFKVQMEMAGALKPDQRARMESRITEQLRLVKKYESEKEVIRREAEQSGRDYDAMNVHDDQFDLAEACLSVAIALAGVTALTRKRWLFGIAIVFAGIGMLFGLAGFFHWQLHSDLMARLLG